MPTGYTATIAGDICKMFMVCGSRGLDSKTNHSENRGGREACGGSGAVFCRSEDFSAILPSTSCAVLCRHQVLKPNREVHEIGDNFNPGLGETLLAAALNDEGDAAPPGFHGATAIEYMHKMVSLALLSSPIMVQLSQQ